MWEAHRAKARKPAVARSARVRSARESTRNLRQLFDARTFTARWPRVQLHQSGSRAAREPDCSVLGKALWSNCISRARAQRENPTVLFWQSALVQLHQSGSRAAREPDCSVLGKALWSNCINARNVDSGVGKTTAIRRDVHCQTPPKSTKIETEHGETNPQEACTYAPRVPHPRFGGFALGRESSGSQGDARGEGHHQPATPGQKDTERPAFTRRPSAR
jgi:hypothetical protein